MKRLPCLSFDFFAAFFLSVVWLLASSQGLAASVACAVVFVIATTCGLQTVEDMLSLNLAAFRYWWILTSLWTYYFVFEVLTVPLGVVRWTENCLFSFPFFLFCLATERLEGNEFKRGRLIVSDGKPQFSDATWMLVRAFSGLLALVIGLDLGLTSTCYTAPLFENSLLILIPVNCLNAYADFRSSMTTAACFNAAVSYVIVMLGEGGAIIRSFWH